MRKTIYSLIAALACVSVSAAEKTLTLSSPDGKNIVTVETTPSLTYSVSRNGAAVLSPSPIAMNVSGEVWGESGPAKKVVRTTVDQIVHFPVARKYPSTREHYNQLELQYKNYSVQLRAYNDAVAYRFVGKAKTTGDVLSEKVRYNFAEDYTAYTLMTKNLQNWFEENYTVKPFSQQPKDSISIQPVMVDEGKCKVVLSEANLYNYAGLYYKTDGNAFEGVFAYYPKTEEPYEGGAKTYVVTREDYIVRCALDRSFPWRVMGLFDREADILNSEIVYLLSDAATGDFSWIKPGMVMWDWWNDNNIYNVDFQAGINTATYKYMIDFAAANKVPYVLIDAGWSDLFDLLSVSPGMDMQELCRYAQSKGVDIMLWTTWTTFERQMDAAFEQFKGWGVKGVKIDYMDRNDAKMVNFFERVARKAVEYKMLIDFHGSYPNEGMRRKYPVLMTREGVMGLEYNKWATTATPKHDVTIPYLRMFVGPMDYTPGAMLNGQGEAYFVSRPEPMSQGTRVHQMAMYIVYESPLQMLSDSPTKYIENKECFDFIKGVPVVWDQTYPVSGKIGENIVVARQKDGVWYLGAMGGNEAQELEIDLSFLGPGSYTMRAFSDGINADKNGKDYKVQTQTVDGGTKLKVRLARGGGFAAEISKK